MKLPGSEPDFFLSKIMRPRWLELLIATTDFDSPFKFEPAKFYCTIFKKGGNSTLFLLFSVFTLDETHVNQYLPLMKHMLINIYP
jgi:hypothetical protein